MIIILMVVVSIVAVFVLFCFVLILYSILYSFYSIQYMPKQVLAVSFINNQYGSIDSHRSFFCVPVLGGKFVGVFFQFSRLLEWFTVA